MYRFLLRIHYYCINIYYVLVSERNLLWNKTVSVVYCVVD